MNDGKDKIDLYTGLIMSAEQKAFFSEMENADLRLRLMKANELLELTKNHPLDKSVEPESKSGKLLYRNNASKAAITSPEFRHDFTYGGRAVFDEELLELQRKDAFTGIKFSFTADATGCDYRHLLETLSSISGQTYQNYEVVITDNSDKKHFHISKILGNAANSLGGRLKVNSEPSGDFIIEMRPGDLLHPATLYLMAKKITEDTNAVYADIAGFEDYPQNVSEGYPLYGPFDEVKPEVKPIAARKGAEGGKTVHIPVVLYYARGAKLFYELPQERAGVQGSPLVSIIICNKDHKDILERCISSIEEKTTWNNYEIIICENNSTEDDIREYYKSLESDTKVRVITWEGGAEFNFSALNNFAAESAKGEYLVFLNNDTEVIEGGWIEALLESAQKEGAGITGCLLVYPDDTIQHAGMCMSGGDVFHLGMHETVTYPGYLGCYARPREVSSVTAACMMVSKAVWDELGGFDEEFKVAYNDVDLCLRARAEGYKIEYTPYAKLYHHEGKSRGFRRLDEKTIKVEQEERMMFLRKHPVITLSDPFYSPNFLPDGHCLEKLPEQSDRMLGKILWQYKDIPFFIDGDCPSSIARQAVYVASVILGKTKDISLTFGDETASEYILFTDLGNIDSIGAGSVFLAAIGGIAVIGVGIEASGSEEFTWKSGRLLATGFHAPEGETSWTCEAETTITLPCLTKADHEFTILQGAQIPLGPLGLTEFPLEVRINDGFKTVITINEENNGKDLTFDVPADAICDGMNKVTMTTSMWSPTDYGAPDARRLGFSCRGIRAVNKNVL